MSIEDIDTSFSGIVNKIQDDKTKGRELAIKLVDEYFHLEDEICSVKAVLQKLESRQCQVHQGIDNIANHLKCSKPFYIENTREGLVYVEQTEIIRGNKIL